MCSFSLLDVYGVGSSTGLDSPGASHVINQLSDLSGLARYSSGIGSRCAVSSFCEENSKTRLGFLDHISTMPEALEVGIFSQGRSLQVLPFISAEVLMIQTAIYRKKPDKIGLKSVQNGHFCPFWTRLATRH